MNIELQKNLFRLYSKHNIKFETLEQMFELTKINPNEDLICTYCGKILELTDSENELKRMSLDHRIPKYWGGKNTIENLVPYCNLCNTIKSTMQEQTYREFLKSLHSFGIKEKVFQELYPGQKIKNKIWELI